jgi:BirA family biotin operon repressor/biotin-[acetyl-CoA-carboxylase] ligase
LTYTPNYIESHVLWVEQTHSTNDLAKQWLLEEKLFPGQVLVANYQTSGRGQHESKWESSPGKNLLCTYVMDTQKFPIEHQPLFNMAISCAVRNTIQDFIPQHKVMIKWPNDLFVQHKKIAGLLIENSLLGSDWHSSIVGIGININQMEFQTPMACSIIQFTQQETLITDLLNALSANIKKVLLQSGLSNDTRDEYHKHLYKKEEQGVFILNGIETNGMILGVDDHGKLIILINQEVHHVSHPKIKMKIETDENSHH